MPLIDINAPLHRPLGETVTEAWVVDAPAASFGAAVAGAKDTRVKDYLVGVPGRLSDLDRRVAAHRAAGGRAVVRIHPGPDDHGYPLTPWALRPIPEYCAREEFALVVDPRAQHEPYPWAEIVAVARGWPRLAVVALGAPLGGFAARRALDVTANLILETSAVTPDDAEALAELAATRGGYRLAFGSGTRGVDPSVVGTCLTASDADAVFSGTAIHLGSGTWSATYL